MLLPLRLLVNLAIASMLLSACTTALYQPIDQRQLSYHDPQQLHCWHVTGKIAVRTSDVHGSAFLDWQYHDGRSILSLRDPFGPLLLTLQQQPGRVVVMMRDGKQYIDRTLPALIAAHHLMWPVPLSSLVFWVRGLPVSQLPSFYPLRSARDRQLVQFQQAGWWVMYRAWHHVEGMQLPSQMLLRATDAPVEVKILINRWILC